MPTGYEIRLDVLGSAVWTQFELPAGYPSKEAAVVSITATQQHLQRSGSIKRRFYPPLQAIVSSQLPYMAEHLNEKAQTLIGEVAIFVLVEELTELLRGSSEDAKLGDFGCLSSEIIFHVFSFLDFPHLGQITSVCSSWKEFADSDLLWKEHAETYQKGRTFTVTPLTSSLAPLSDVSVTNEQRRQRIESNCLRVDTRTLSSKKLEYQTAAAHGLKF
jgi:hypothetical protein